MPKTNPLLDRYFHMPFMPRLRLKVADFDPNVEVTETTEYFHIRYARPEDVPKCLHLAYQLWPIKDAERYPVQIEESFRRAAGRPAFFVAVRGNGDVIGFSGVRPSWMMKDTFELIGVNVHPDYQDIGLGRVLHELRMDLVRALDGRYVIVSTIQPAFFARMGFTAIDQCDEWTIMRRQLTNR